MENGRWMIGGTNHSPIIHQSCANHPPVIHQKVQIIHQQLQIDWVVGKRSVDDWRHPSFIEHSPMIHQSCTNHSPIIHQPFINSYKSTGSLENDRWLIGGANHSPIVYQLFINPPPSIHRSFTNHSPIGTN